MKEPELFLLSKVSYCTLLHLIALYCILPVIYRRSTVLLLLDTSMPPVSYTAGSVPYNVLYCTQQYLTTP